MWRVWQWSNWCARATSARAALKPLLQIAKKRPHSIIAEEGHRAVRELGIDELHPELVKLVGKLKYRTSFGQNVLGHSKEVAFLAAQWPRN